MSFEMGGRSDKLGNRYEGRWVLKQFLTLLMEKHKSVVVEAIGDDEQGVDLWVEKTIIRENANNAKHAMVQMCHGAFLY